MKQDDNDRKSKPCVVIKKCGTPIAGGAIGGRAWVVATPVAGQRHRQKVHPKHHKREEGSIRNAIQLLSFVIESAIHQVTMRAGETHAQVFIVLKEILHDPTIMERIVAAITTKNYNAFAAVREVFGGVREDLGRNSVLKDGGILKDLIELEQSLLDALVNPAGLFQQEHRPERGTEGRIMLCKNLTPRLVLESRGKGVVGIIAESGGENSHAAILCRALGIPAVSGIAGVCTERFDGASVALNGATGEVALSRSRKDLSGYVHPDVLPAMRPRAASAPERVVIFANINLSEHGWQALSAGASGIGLYRTELEFLAAGRFLTEEEQLAKYRNLVITMMGMPVVIRLLDVSRDKVLPILDTIGYAVDPMLEGADFLEANPEILKQQARAIAKTSDLGNVKILYPMIRSARQFRSLKRMVVTAAEEAGAPSLEHGVMFEVPSACEEADEIFADADFGSLGTNDLLKHLLGTDRETGSVEFRKETQNALVWKYIAMVAASARKAGKPLTVCGEMASHHDFVQRFIGLGIHAVSVDFVHVRRLKLLMSQFDDGAGLRTA